MNKVRKSTVLMMVFYMFAVIFIMGNADHSVYAAQKNNKAAAIKTVKLKIGKKNVTGKTYRMYVGEEKKLKTYITPNTKNKSITYKTTNKKAVTVSKKGRLKAVGTGTAKIKICVKVRGSGKKVISKKTSWVKIKAEEKKKPEDTTEEEKQEEKTKNPIIDKKSIVIPVLFTE